MKPNSSCVNVDVTSYKSTPHTLITLAQEYINNKHYDTSISILDTAIKYAIDLYKHKTHINLAKYYSKYAEAFIYKLMDSDDLFKQIPTNTHSNNEQQSNDNEKVIVTYLALAENIYTDHITNYKEECYYSELADVYKLYGEYQKAFSDFKKASEHYQKAIDIRISKLHDKHSRILAEMYFNKASVLDFNAKECLLFYYKTLKILEYHLVLCLNVNETAGITVHEDCDCTLNEIDISDERIYINRKVIENISNEVLNNEGRELKEIISDIYFKIEDVILEIKEYDKYIEEKNKMKERNSGIGVQDCFTMNYDVKKVLDISAGALVRKKKKRKCVDENELLSEDTLINEIQSKEKVITKF